MHGHAIVMFVAIDKDSDKDKRVLIIGVLAGGSLLIVIVSTVVILYALVRFVLSIA